MNRNQGQTQRNTRVEGQSRDQQAAGDQKRERSKKESIIDLSKFVDKNIRVKFQGGRETTGKLKGYDQFLNLVLDESIEHIRDPDDSNKISGASRKLGLIVCRGPAVTVICPQDGHEPIQNPFLT